MDRLLRLSIANQVIKFWSRCKAIALTISPRDLLFRAVVYRQLFTDARWLSKGDRKEQGADGTSQDQDISNAFHVNNS